MTTPTTTTTTTDTVEEQQHAAGATPSVAAATPLVFRWFVVKAQSGHEERAREQIIERLAHVDLADQVETLVVPVREEWTIRNGKRHSQRRTIYPGYIFASLVPSEQLFFEIKQARGVSGFVGDGKPEPLPADEVERIKLQVAEPAAAQKMLLRAGEVVRVVDGPFAEFEARVDEIYPERGRVRVLVAFFERDTPIELDFLQIEKIEGRG